jgi:hypothetical protein
VVAENSGKAKNMLKKSLLVTLLLLTYAVTSAAQELTNHTHRLSLPEKNWALEVSLPDFSVSRNAVSPDGQAGRLDASVESKGFMLTIMLATALQAGTSKELRELGANALKQSPVEKDGFKLSEYKEFPMLEYLVKEFRGVRLNQKHYNAYIARDGVWIDIHLSKINFSSGDEKRFFEILDSVKIVDAKPRK